MSEFLLNNFFVFLGSYFVAGFCWIGITKIDKARIRRILKATTIFLVIPIIFPGHPVIFTQPWMLFLGYIEQSSFQLLGVLAVIWLVVIGLSQIGVKTEDEQGAL